MVIGKRSRIDMTNNNCRYCEKPLRISKGQIVYWHKECRYKGRNSERRRIKREK